MKKTCLLIILGLILLEGCTKKKREEKPVSEGVDTSIEVTSYHEHKDKDYFLKNGDKVAVISPSSYPDEKKRDAVINGLKDWGYEPVEGKYTVGENRTLENVIEDLKWALEDPDIKAIFCIRGGAASSEVLDNFDLGMIRENRKPIIGFSDITTFLSAWSVKGLPSIHAAMAGTFMDLCEECVEVEKHILQGEIPTYKCQGNKHNRQGTAQGVLIGGNLSVMLSVIASDFDPTETDEPYILFLEDVAENTEHIHRYLTLLKHAGILDKASGLIFGEWTDLPLEAEAYNGNSRGGRFDSIADMIDRQFLKGLDIPVAFGFPAGHDNVNYPLLMGSEIRLQVDKDSYTIEWK